MTMATHRIKQNRVGNWVAYTSGKHVQYFYSTHLAGSGRGADDQREQAEQWLRERNAAQVEADHGAQLTSLWLGHSRTQLTVDTTDAGYAAALVQAAVRRQLPVSSAIVQKGRTLGRRVAHIRVTFTPRIYDLRVQRSQSGTMAELLAVSDAGRAYLDAECYHFAVDSLAGYVEDAITAGLRVQTQ